MFSSTTNLDWSSLLISGLKLPATKMGTDSLTLQVYEKHWQKLQPKHCPSPPIKSSTDRCLISSGGRTLRVYTDIPQVEEILKRPEFLISMCCYSSRHTSPYFQTYWSPFDMIIICPSCA